MATFLMVQGMEAVELDESFNKVRRRLDEVNPEDKPFSKLSFKTAEGGRISVNFEKVIGVGSDEPKDQGSGEE